MRYIPLALKAVPHNFFTRFAGLFESVGGNVIRKQDWRADMVDNVIGFEGWCCIMHGGGGMPSPPAVPKERRKS